MSDWILNGFKGKSPELAEFIGAVEIKRSELSGRCLFATKNMETWILLLATKAIATDRCSYFFEFEIKIEWLLLFW